MRMELLKNQKNQPLMKLVAKNFGVDVEHRLMQDN